MLQKQYHAPGRAPMGRIQKNPILYERVNEKRYGLPFVTL
jgi:hypothetical protein